MTAKYASRWEYESGKIIHGTGKELYNPCPDR
jgi:hypothetical protein